MADRGRSDEGDGAPDEPTDPSEPDRERSEGASERTLKLALAAAVLFAVIAVVMSIVAATGGSGDNGPSDDVARVAGRFSEALYTVDHEDLDGYRERVTALATGSFESEFEDAADVLFPLLLEQELVQIATVQDVFVGEIDDGTAEAVVAVDLQTTINGRSFVQLNNYVRVGLVEIAGAGWQIDNFIYLDFSGTGDPLALLEDPPG